MIDRVDLSIACMALLILDEMHCEGSTYFYDVVFLVDDRLEIPWFLLFIFEEAAIRRGFMEGLG